MRKLSIRLVILGILLSLWSPIAHRASAGVSCSVPFTLTNGTPADATQVMANYNALIACLAQAASAGANTDITSLLGITTPLPPAAGGSSLFIGGTSTGSANAQSVGGLVPNSYVLANKSFVVFTAGFTNGGPLTLNVGGTGAIAVVQHAQSGLIPLAGGEVVTGQATQVYYNGTSYELFGLSPQALVQPCTEINYQGTSVPSGYLVENGAAVSRTTYANLFACMAFQVSATTNGSGIITVPNSGLGMQVGWFVGGNNVVCNSFITGFPDGTHIQLNQAASGSGATTLSIGPQPQGDCTATFNLPNMYGRASVGQDPTGAVLTSAACANSIGGIAGTGVPCGSVNQKIGSANLPAVALSVTASGTIAGSTSGYAPQALIGAAGAMGVPIGAASAPATAGGAAIYYPTTQFGNIAVTGFSSLSVSGSASVTGNTSVMGSGSALLLQPIQTVNKAIKF